MSDRAPKTELGPTNGRDRSVVGPSKHVTKGRPAALQRLQTRVANVLAVVVTYNPGDDLAENLASLSAQAQVIVVDNGSSDVGSVEAAARAAGCRLLMNGTNLGVAAALNQAARIAAAEGFEWLATFDQDSLVPAGALKDVISSFAAHPSREDIAIVSMARRDRGTGSDYTPAWAILEDTPTWRSVRTTITSGSLIRVEILMQLGCFDETLFIDSVDHDFALRCRKAGYLVIEDKTTILQHSIGCSTSHRLLGHDVIISNHSETRQYYKTRNLLEVIRRSLAIDATWSWWAFVYMILGIAEVCLYEKHRGAKISAMIEGVRDFLLRDFGPRRSSRRGKPWGAHTSIG